MGLTYCGTDESIGCPMSEGVMFEREKGEVGLAFRVVACGWFVGGVEKTASKNVGGICRVGDWSEFWS